MAWLTRFKQWLTRNRASRFDDEQLGPLILNENVWEARVDVGGRTVVLSVGGRYEPDAVLIEEARRIHADLDAFLARVKAFLGSEADRMQFESRAEYGPIADEVRALVVREVSLC